jgi:RNA-directed DNA polymerase
VTERAQEQHPAGVPWSHGAKQAGEVRARWAWTEPAVWTERMLTALEEGVKGGKWFSLIDKVYALPNLRAAFARVKRNGGAAGVDHQTVEHFERHLEENLQELSQALRSGSYRPQAIRRKWIPKLGSKEKRPLGVPTVRDRVVQGALRQVLEPIFERDFAEQSYGFRPNRGSKDALRRVEDLLKRGNAWVVDADFQGYFDTIPRGLLMERVGEKVADSGVLALLRAFLAQEVLGSMKAWTPEEGTPQGAVVSPLLSNIYLDPLDHRMARRKVEMVRYADDFVILSASREEAEEVLGEVQQWVEKAGLQLHPEKTRIVDARQEGFDFLGYHFQRGMRWPRKKSLAKLKDTIRPKTRRTNGHSLPRIILGVNRTLVGWFEYFKHSHWTTFPRLDSWIRRRLRSILRKRQHCKGGAWRSDNRRWPNAFFAKQGLFSLVTAHALARQSLTR